MVKFYSHGKLLITSEYAILDGVKGLAVPTKYGQSLTVSKTKNSFLQWTSLNESNEIWFTVKMDIEDSRLNILETSDEKTAQTLVHILSSAKDLSENTMNLKGKAITTNLDFNRHWGLGTSSTLINNVATWFQVNAYTLLNNTFGGSGYDIACAQTPNPIIYWLDDGIPTVSTSLIEWPFKEHIYFVYLNQKQNSRDGISDYKSKNLLSSHDKSNLNRITNDLLLASNLNQFENLIEEHNQIIGRLIGQKPLTETLFKGFNGSIKNLGAWGGDFIMVSSEIDPTNYFKEKGLTTILSYNQMVL